MDTVDEPRAKRHKKDKHKHDRKHRHGKRKHKASAEYREADLEAGALEPIPKVNPSYCCQLLYTAGSDPDLPCCCSRRCRSPEERAMQSPASLTRPLSSTSMFAPTSKVQGATPQM